MDLLKHYLKDRRRALGGFFCAEAAAALVFWLYGLPQEPALYAAAITATLLLLFFALPDFIAYSRRVRDLEALRKTVLSLSELPPPSGPFPERQLEAAVARLCGEIRELETAYEKKRKDMLEYYTLWVHQIKTPLSAMRLILRSAGDGNPGSESSSEDLLQELFKVERYVEMVLGYLRLDSMNSDLLLERCSVYEIVKQAVKKFAPQFIYRKLSLDLRPFDNRVVTDRKWLLFVIEQLLSNALKYTPEGGVSISMGQDDVLILRDTGTGISAEDLPRVFERGFTGYNGRQEKTSTGLGLYLTKQVVDKLQNRIEIFSQPGQGTEVRLYLHRDETAVF